MPSTQVADRPKSDLVVWRQNDRPVSTDLDAPAAPSLARPAADDHLPAIAIRAMLGIGRTLVVIGILLLLFAAFQLWGTGLSEARAQAELTARFEQQLGDAATVGPAAEGVKPGRPEPETLVVEVPTAPESDSIGGHDTGRAPDKPFSVQAVAVGDPIGVLSIPAIDLTKTFSEGTTRDALRGGPGHYPSTPLPGQRGNVAIAGHRTTHGAPFLNVDQLEPGDAVTIETVAGTYTYAVEGQLDADGNEVGHQIVGPEDVGVIMDRGDDRLTLTACHPKYSARQRIIVSAVLISSPSPPVIQAAPQTPATENEAPAEQSSEDHTIRSSALDTQMEPQPTIEEAVPSEEQSMEPSESLGWQPRYAGPTVAWAVATAFITLLGYCLGQLWRRFPAYLMTVPPVALALYYCFVNLERFIPAA